MFQNQEKFRKHFTAGKTTGFISYSHSLYSSFHSWKPCQRRSYTTAAFSTMQKLGRWQGGLPRSECQKPGNQPFFLLHISLGPAPLHPSPLPFPAGRHPAYLCLSRPLACLDTARKCAKRAGGHRIKSHHSSHPVWETRLCRAEHASTQGANPDGSSGPVARLWQLSSGCTGTQPHTHTAAQFMPCFLPLLRVMEIGCCSLEPEANCDFSVADSCNGQFMREKGRARDIPGLRSECAI